MTSDGLLLALRSPGPAPHVDLGLLLATNLIPDGVGEIAVGDEVVSL